MSMPSGGSQRGQRCQRCQTSRKHAASPESCPFRHCRGEATGRSTMSVFQVLARPVLGSGNGVGPEMALMSAGRQMKLTLAGRQLTLASVALGKSVAECAAAFAAPVVVSGFLKPWLEEAGLELHETVIAGWFQGELVERCRQRKGHRCSDD